MAPRQTIAAPNKGTQEAGAYWEKFKRLEQGLGQPAWLLQRRQAGMARFAEVGFPTLQHEDWRFTNIAPIVKLPFKPLFQPGQAALSSECLKRFTFASLKATRLVFVNGHYARELSTPVAQENGVKIGSLAAALPAEAGLLEAHLARLVGGNAFAALNTAFFQNGAFIHVPEGRVVKEPIHLLFITTANEAGATTHPRNLIVAEKGSQVTVLESYAATVDVTELIVGDGAVVEHCKFQDESVAAFHLATISARLGRRANFVSHSIALGSRLSRNDIRAELAGEGLECVLNGLYLTRGEQLADHHMIIEHAQPHCASHEYFNGILDDKSKGVFHGRILVQPVAQKTDAKQTNKNLLLSDEATIDTKPQLEIYADDVKCTHGATVGQLNEESIFYLRSRGIGSETARRMLIHAFAGEIIERIRHEPARAELDKLVWERLEANSHLAGK
jgi:Fe-S cluster assembly protein SufD